MSCRRRSRNKNCNDKLYFQRFLRHVKLAQKHTHKKTLIPNIINLPLPLSFSLFFSNHSYFLHMQLAMKSGYCLFRYINMSLFYIYLKIVLNLFLLIFFIRVPLIIVSNNDSTENSSFPLLLGHNLRLNCFDFRSRRCNTATAAIPISLSHSPNLGCVIRNIGRYDYF